MTWGSAAVSERRREGARRWAVKNDARRFSLARASARETRKTNDDDTSTSHSLSLSPPPKKKNNNKKPGGAVLSWIDVAAGLAAKTLARGPVVTASVDAVAFLRPARRGSVAIVAAMVNRVFRSSAEVGVRVEEEVLATGERRHCCSAYLTFVSVGRAGVAPVAVMPPVAPGDGAQAEVFAAAERRRAERLAARARARECPGELPPRLQPVTHRGGGMPTLGPPLLAGAAAAAAAAAAMASSSSLYSSSALPPPSRPQPQRIPPAATLSHMTQLILPQHANSLGITFGGVVLNWVEQCAHIAGARAGRCLGSSGAKNTTKSSRGGGGGGGIGGGGNGGESEFPTSRVLTAGMDSVAFGAPTRVGDVLYVSAQVTAVWGEEFVSLAFFGERERELFGAEGERERRSDHEKLTPVFLLLCFPLSLSPLPQSKNQQQKQKRRVHGGDGLRLRRDSEPWRSRLRVRRRVRDRRRRRRFARETCRPVLVLELGFFGGGGGGTAGFRSRARHPLRSSFAGREAGRGRGREEAGEAADAAGALGARAAQAEPRRAADVDVVVGGAGRGPQQGRRLRALYSRRARGEREKRTERRGGVTARCFSLFSLCKKNNNTRQKKRFLVSLSLSLSPVVVVQSSWSTPGSSPTLPPPACARSHAARGLAGFMKSSA